MDINTDKNQRNVKFDRQVLNDPKFLRFSVDHLVEDCQIVQSRGSQYVINPDVIKGKLDLKGKTQFASKQEAIEYLLEAIYPEWQMQDTSSTGERRFGTA